MRNLSKKQKILVGAVLLVVCGLLLAIQIPAVKQLGGIETTRKENPQPNIQKEVEFWRGFAKEANN